MKKNLAKSLFAGMAMLAVSGVKAQQMGSWSYETDLIYGTFPNTNVHIGDILDDGGPNNDAKLIVDGHIAIYDGCLFFNDWDNVGNPQERKIVGNAGNQTLTIYGQTSFQDGPVIRMWGNDFTNTIADEGMTFSVNGCGSGGGRSAFSFIQSPLTGTCSTTDELMKIRRDGLVIASGFTAPLINATTTLKANALGNGTGNQLVLSQSDGTLTAQSVPGLSIAGSTLTLDNGGSIHSSVALPSGADNLGNHTATQNLNMSGKNINSVNTITFSGGVSLQGGSSPFFNGAIGVGAPVSGINALTVGGTGLFNGDVTANSFTTASDKRFKKNIEPVESITDKLFKVQSYSYSFNNDFPDKNFDDKKHFGFIAQEVREVFPNLVREIDPEKHLGVNYIEFIPLLLQSYKEEQQKVADLENRIADLENKISALTISGTNTVTDPQPSFVHSYLNQNVPNPFSQETRISFFIAEKYTSAFIGIYDMNGKELKKLPVMSGMSTVIVNAGDLAAGMYMYSLVINGKLFDTKKMVLSGN